MLREGLLFLSAQPTLQRIAVQNPMARAVAGRFVAGDTLQDALRCVSELNRHGMAATLDHLGENVATREEAENSAAAYIAGLNGIAAEGVESNISLKLSSIGLDVDRDLAVGLLTKIVDVAAGCDNFVRVDMEGSAYTEITLEIVRGIFARNIHVGTVIQSYLYRSEDDVRALNALGMRIRLVKGAYLEPPTVAFPDKADVDENYRRLADLLLHEGTYPAFATHDERIIDWILERARVDGIPPQRFEFQMLFGVRRDIQERLQQRGYNVRIYIPYGTQWYPYFMRRLAERPANVLFLAGSLARELRAH